MRQRILLAVLTGLALLAPATVAGANPTQMTTIEAPHELLTGSPGAGLDLIQDLGADGVRILIPWRDVAPQPDARRAPRFDASDPNAYPPGAWHRFDLAIDGARARGLRVHVTLAGPAPDWATPKRDGLTRPNANQFGRFATAAGRRYGTRVTWWSLWNEPNLGKFLKPIARNQSARVYRNLYLRGYAGLRSAGVRKPILLGELAPIGNSIKGNGTIRPLRFLRAMLCLDNNYRRLKGRRCAKVPTQGLALHPYSNKAGPFLVPPADNVTIGVLDRATTALDRAARAGALPRRLPIFITEFGVQSYPDKRVGVPLATQSDYRSIAEYIAYRNPRVRMFSQYLLLDDEDTTGGYRYGAFESGLFLRRNGKPKPALRSFRLPLVVTPNRRARTRATLWGLVRPAKAARRAGRVQIEYRDRRGGWKRLGAARHNARGYWKRGAPYRPGRAFRVRWTAPDGTRHTGPATIARSAPRSR